MATPAQNQAAITAAIQAAAVADAVLLNAFVVTNGSSFSTLIANFQALQGTMSSTLRAAQVAAISAQLSLVLANFATLQSTTFAAETTVPIA